MTQTSLKLSDLKAKSPKDLLAMAEELEIENATTMRKGEMMFQILRERADEGWEIGGFAPTLGDVGTTLSHPASSSHRAMDAATREGLGMSEGFFRVSVGLEDPDALFDVFTQAVASASKA